VSSARQQQQVLALTRQLDADLRDTQKVLAQELLGLRQQVKVRQLQRFEMVQIQVICACD
jgi:hypothetical protein